MVNGTVVREHEQYSIVLNESGQIMLFSWLHVTGLKVADFGHGIAEFANQCQAHKPDRAVIDARKIDPTSPAVSWISAHSKVEVEGEEAHLPWWTREIVPIYHAAGIASLAVATNDPDAPGERGGQGATSN